MKTTLTVLLTGAFALLCATGCDSAQDGGPVAVSTGSGGGTSTTIEPDQLYAGFRSSRYGIRPFPDPDYWTYVGTTYAGKLQGAVPGGIWIVGVIHSDTTCYLNFPNPGGGPYPDIDFADSDENQAYLNDFDENGVKVWLQVEPADADLETLIDLVLGQYGSHPSVIGFGVDVEWHRPSEAAPGQMGVLVTEAEATAWLQATQSYNPDYTLFLKHWETNMMPPAQPGLVFVNDSMELGSLSALVSEFQRWGRTYSQNEVGFQIGYSPDRSWWEVMEDPPGEIGQALLDAIPNTAGLFWVDFTLREVFPED